MRKLILELFSLMFLIVLSADLLYLYYNGQWYDPYPGIEIAELVLLCLIPVFAIIKFYFFLRGEK